MIKSNQYTSEEYSKLQHSWRRRLRCEVLKAYGSVCACCGEGREILLSIDHINGNGAEHRRATSLGHGGYNLYSQLRKDNWPSGYQVLCHNCNKAKGVGATCLCKTVTDTVDDVLQKIPLRNASQRGENHNQHKLTLEQVRCIRSKFATGEYSKYGLAVEYKVSVPNIHAIISGKTWKDS